MAKADKSERFPGLTVVLVLAVFYLPLGWFQKNQNLVEVAGMMFLFQIVRTQPKWSILTWFAAVMTLVACAFAGNSDWTRLVVGLAVMMLGLPLRRFFPPEKASDSNPDQKH